MGFKKFFCTCVGCVVGAACIALTGGAATPLVATALIGGAGTAGYFIGDKQEKDEKKLKNQEQDLTLRQQNIENLTKDNERLQKQEVKENQKLKELEERIESRDKKIEEARKKSQDPNLSEEDRRKWRNELTVLLAQQDDDKKERNGITKTIKELQDKINSNNKNITTINSGSSKKDKDVWEFITLENILIVVAVYALWQITRDNNRRY